MLGERKIDQHIKLWKAMGFNVKEHNSKLILNRCSNSKAKAIESFNLEIDTTMGSAACLIAATFGEISQIVGLSTRPEIRSLIEFLPILKLGQFCTALS